MSVSIGQTMQSIADLLGSAEGTIVLGVAALLAVVSPIADRYIIRRKRIHYRVQYNSKIGLSPVTLHDGSGSARHADPRLAPMARLLDRMSIVVIRIRNTGGFDIAARDFGAPLEFTFGGRVIWNARISEPNVAEHRDELTNCLVFFSTTNSSRAPAETGKLTRVRVSLGQRLSAWLGNSQPDEPLPEPPQWHGVRLSSLSLERKEKFKLVVVLREPDDSSSDEITKEIEQSGHIVAGRIKDERKQRRITWPLVTAAVGVLLTGALIATLIVSGSRPATDIGVPCASGTLTVVGSSAFTPIVNTIAGEYSRACQGAEISVQSTGSIDGVRRVVAVGAADRGTLAALSDGRTSEPDPELVGQAVAVIVYTIVVNDSVGIERLTLDQVKGIYEGRYRDWNELRPGPALPIRIVSRGQESGSRRTFEKTVLGTPEGALSSDSCETHDRGVATPTVRCERGSEAAVISEVTSTQGAIGYIDLPSANVAKADKQAITVLQLDGNYPELSGIPRGYPFWTIEYLYTKGAPAPDSVLKSFIDYLRSGTARAELQTAGYTPCVAKDGQLHHLCRA